MARNDIFYCVTKKKKNMEIDTNLSVPCQCGKQKFVTFQINIENQKQKIKKKAERVTKIIKIKMALEMYKRNF